jgi:hypothetical protein
VAISRGGAGSVLAWANCGLAGHPQVGSTRLAGSTPGCLKMFQWVDSGGRVHVKSAL